MSTNEKDLTADNSEAQISKNISGDAIDYSIDVDEAAIAIEECENNLPPGLVEYFGRTTDVGGYDITDEVIAERIRIFLELSRGTKGAAKNKVRLTYTNFMKVFSEDPVLKHLGISEMGCICSWELGFERPWTAGAPTAEDPSGDTDATDDDDDDMFVTISGKKRKKTEAEKALGNLYVTERDKAYIYDILAKYFNNKLHRDLFKSHMSQWCQMNYFHPLRDYVLSLDEWDGEERIERAIPTVDDTPYSRASLRYFFLSSIQRIFNPGCQVDSMIVLVGAQGLRKTSFCHSILPLGIQEIGEIPAGERHKDTLRRCHEAGIVVLDEIDKFHTKVEVSELKTFITALIDIWRASYAESDTRLARSFTLIGTTNVENFLQDVTGNRRYLPLVVKGVIPDECLTREFMDQALAEALYYYRQGERPRYDKEFQEMAAEAQAKHLDDPYGDETRSVIDSYFMDTWAAFEKVGYTTFKSLPARVSTAAVCQRSGQLGRVDLLRDKKANRAIMYALDNCVYYQRMTGAKTYRVDGKPVRIAWEITPRPFDPVEYLTHSKFEPSAGMRGISMFGIPGQPDYAYVVYDVPERVVPHGGPLVSVHPMTDKIRHFLIQHGDATALDQQLLGATAA